MTRIMIFTQVFLSIAACFMGIALLPSEFRPSAIMFLGAILLRNGVRADIREWNEEQAKRGKSQPREVEVDP